MLIGAYEKPAMQAPSAKAVISVAGPVQGFTPLVAGSDALKQRVKGFSNKLIRGGYAVEAAVSSIVYAIPGIGPYLAAALDLHSAIGGLVPGQSIAWTLKALKWDLGMDETTEKNIIAFLEDGEIAGEGRFVSEKVLEDFNPRSEYTRKYLVGVTQEETGHWARVKHHKVLWWWVYKTVWIKDKPLIKEAPVDMETAVGYIYGTDRDPFNMMGPQGTRSPTVDTAMRGAQLGFFAAGTINLSVAASLANFAVANIWNPIGWAAAVGSVFYQVKSFDAWIAYGISADIPKHWNRDILCTEKSDAFIPEDAAWREITESGGKAIGAYGEYITFYPDNHESELHDERIWGRGSNGEVGSLASPQKNGTVYKWLMDSKQWNDAFSGMNSNSM